MKDYVIKDIKKDNKNDIKDIGTSIGKVIFTI